MYLLNKLFVYYVIVATAPELFKTCVFPEEEDEIIFYYVLEFMLTLAKMQDNSTLI